MEKLIIPIIIISLVVIYYLYSKNDNNKTAEQNRQLGAAFLAQNKAQEGVVETESGLQYQMLRQGQGTQHPQASDSVKVHYHGTLINGKVFDSSVERGEPISFALNQVISGWTEGLQLMVVGEKTHFVIPANLAYGNRSAGIIEPGSTLIFDVELLGINE